MSCNLYGSQTIAPYSSVERTRAMYDNLLHSSGQYIRFLRRNPSVEFAFLTMLVIWVFHCKSFEIVIPKYGLKGPLTVVMGITVYHCL